VITFPAWLTLTLVVVNAVIAALQVQATVPLNAVATLVINLVAVVVSTLLGFQKQTSNTVRRLQGKPTITS